MLDSANTGSSGRLNNRKGRELAIPSTITPSMTLHPAAAAATPSIHLVWALPELHHAPSEVLEPPPHKSESLLSALKVSASAKKSAFLRYLNP